MTTTRRGTWGRILSGVPQSEPNDNVVHMPRPTLDDLERQLIDAQNGVIDAGVECDRAAMVYTERLKVLEAARAKMAERLKESCIKAEFTQHFPEIE